MPLDDKRVSDTDSLHRHRSLEEWLGRHDYKFIQITERMAELKENMEVEVAELREGQERNNRAIRGDNGDRLGLIHDVRIIQRDTQQRAKEQAEATHQIASLAKLTSDLSEDIQPLLFQAKILVYVGAALGISIIGLVWSLIIGQVRIVVP